MGVSEHFWEGFNKKAAGTAGLPDVKPPKAPSNKGLGVPKAPSPRIKGTPAGKSLGGKHGVSSMRI